MFDELPEVPPVVRPIELPPLPEAPAPPQPAALDPQHVQAVDAVFTRNDENSVVAGLLGVWFGGPAVIDHLAEQFGEAGEDRKRRRPHGEAPPPPVSE